MLKKCFAKEFGSEKSYLFVKMQFAIVLSIAISLLYAVLRDGLYLQILPALLLFACFTELYKNYKEDFWLYFTIFLILFLVIVLTPIVFHGLSLAYNPIDSLKYLVFAAFVVLILLVFLRVISAKKIITGRVLLADKNLAVVQVDVDLLTGIRAGRYVVENKGAKKGDYVRISVKRGLFRGPYLHSIVGKRA